MHVPSAALGDVWTIPGWGLVAAALALATVVGLSFLALVVALSWRSKIRKSKSSEPPDPL